MASYGPGSTNGNKDQKGRRISDMVALNII